MTTLRHRLHLWAAAWLVFQVATLTALVPQDCCAAHTGAHTSTHKAAAPSTHAEHQMHHGMVHDATPKPTPAAPIGQCMMRGTCKGPMAAVVALLSQHGVPPSSAVTFAPHVNAAMLIGVASEHVTSRLIPPDSPPPRA